MLRVSASPAVRIAEAPGAPALRHQFKAAELALAANERKQLDAAPTPEARAALKAEFTQARAERARRYAAMVCSQPGWKPKPGASPESKVLTSFYGLLGERARADAARSGKPLSMAHVEQVRLSRADVEGLRTTFSDGDIARALPLLDKHIAHADFLDDGALRFMTSDEFLSARAALAVAADKVESALDKHEAKLAEEAHARLLEHQRDDRKHRRLVEISTPDLARVTDGKRVFKPFGGRLAALDE